MNEYNKYELLDKYLTGKLNEEELSAFEHFRAEDKEFAREVQESIELVGLMQDFEDTQTLKKQLAKNHESIPQSQPSKRNQTWFTIGIAASFSLLAVFSTLFTIGHFSSKKTVVTSPIQELSFQDLSDNVSEIQGNQENLELKIKEIESSIQTETSRNGTCFPLTNSGLLVTNYHVITEAKKVMIVSHTSDIPYNVEVIYKDKDLDLAILKITDTTFSNFGGIPYSIVNRIPKLAEGIYTLGYPKKEVVYGEGCVSSGSGYNGDTTKFEVSIPVNPGNSGSPVFDKYGNIIGLIDSKNKDKVGTSYVVKAEYLKSAIENLPDEYINEVTAFNQRNRIKWKSREEQVSTLLSKIYRVRVIK